MRLEKLYRMGDCCPDIGNCVFSPYLFRPVGSLTRDEVDLVKSLPISAKLEDQEALEKKVKCPRFDQEVTILYYPEESKSSQAFERSIFIKALCACKECPHVSNG